MREEVTDPAPEPRKNGLGPARVRMGRARPSWVSLDVAILIGAAMIGLAWLSTLDSGRAPARMRLARGEGDPQRRVTALALAFSPDGTTIATIHTDGRVALRDPTEGRGLRFLGDRGYAWALAFSPDGRHLALGGFGPDITLCDLETEGAEDPLKMPIPEATALAFSPDGRILAAASRLTDRILLWDLAARRERARLRGHSSPVLSLAFAPDGRSLASGGGIRDQAIIVWDLATGGRRLRLETPGFVTALAYSPDGSLLASASGFDGSVRIWDPAAGRLVCSISSRATSRNPMAFAPGGRLLATADDDGTVKFWSVATGRRLASLDGQADFLRGVAFSPDGRTLAAIGSDDDVRLWDAAEVIGDPTDHPTDR
jgi:WD domain, G-beta repeat